MTPLRIRVPDEQIGGLVGDDCEEVPVLVPSEADAHPGEADLVEDLGVTAVDVHNLYTNEMNHCHLCLKMYKNKSRVKAHYNCEIMYSYVLCL